MKEGRQETEAEGLHAKFHVNVFIVMSASGGRKPQFWANFDSWGLLYRSACTDEGQIWCAKADRTSTLTGQISSECVHCVAFRWPKTTILGTFLTLRGSCTGSLLPISVKFGVLKQTGRLHSVSYTHLTLPTIYSV